MTIIDVRYTRYDNKIEYAKVNIEENVYQMIQIKEEIDEEKTIKSLSLDIHNDDSAEVINIEMNKDELNQYIKLLRQISNEL